jgi:hypothetical protein
MIAGVIALGSAVALAGTVGLPARFRAVVFDTEAGRSAPLEISITRWSTPEEVERLSSAFNDQGPDGLLRRLQQAPRVGSWRTPGSLASDLRFAQQTPDKNGGWRVMLMTDRHIDERGLLASDDIEVGGDGGDIDDLTCGAQLVGGVEPHLTEHSQVVY